MDFLWFLLLYGSSVICGILPWVLVIVAIRNRKVWGLWQRTGWKGSLAFTLLNFGLKIGAFYWAFLVQIGSGQRENATAQSVYQTLNFLDVGLLKLVTNLAQMVLSEGAVDSRSSNVGSVLDFLVVFGLFCGVRWVWARFVKPADNPE